MSVKEESDIEGASRHGVPIEGSGTDPEARSASRLAFFLSFLLGLVFALLFPPFTIADEPAHFYRAYLLSEGRLHAQLLSGRAGAYLPASLPEAASICLSDLVQREEVRFQSDRWLAAWSIRLAPERRTFVDFPNSGMLPFLPYAPQALGIALGRSVSLPPVALVYLGRLVNMLVASWLVAVAIRRLPGWRWPLVLLSLSPAALSARSSLSPDSLTFALALGVAASALSGALGVRGRITAFERTAPIAEVTALCLTKLPYAPLLLAATPGVRSSVGRRWLPSLGIALVAAGPAMLYSSWCAARVQQPLRADVVVDRDGQIHRALSEPGHFLRSTTRTLDRHGSRLLADLWGAKLGWLDVSLPMALPWLLGLTFLVLILIDTPSKGRLSWVHATAFAAAILASTAAIALSQYATWTPVSPRRIIHGLQGRYFLPVMPFVVGFLGALSPARRVDSPQHLVARTIAVTVSLAGFLASSVSVYLRYWGS